MTRSRNWTWDETLVAFRLYCRTPFGKLHKTNPQIVALAQKLGRTSSAVGMKACNFASLDPILRARGIKGLTGRSHFEKEIWEKFHTDSVSLATEAELAYDRLCHTSLSSAAQSPLKKNDVEGPTSVERRVMVRRVQQFFRRAVLTSYGGHCAITGLSIRSLLNASHIIPWSASVSRRADPSNGICLNAFHDRAFDRGLFTLDEKFRVVPSKVLKGEGLGDLAFFGNFSGRAIRMPERFVPATDALAYHREHVFQG